MQTNNKPLYLLFALFFVPFFLACGLYFGAYHPGTTNKGHLIAKPPNAAFLNTLSFVGKKPPKSWKIIYLAPKTCGEECKTDLNNLNKVWLLLGKHKSRVSLIILTKNPIPKNAFYQARYTVLPATLRKLQNKWPGSRLFIADPLDNLIMAYNTPSWPTSALSDLKKLLKVSQIG